MKYKIIGIALGVVLGTPALAFWSAQTEVFQRSDVSVVATTTSIAEEKSSSATKVDTVVVKEAVALPAPTPIKKETPACAKARAGLKITQDSQLDLKKQLSEVRNGSFSLRDTTDDIKKIQDELARHRQELEMLERELQAASLQEKALLLQIKSCNP